MADQELETQIREVLERESQAISLSEKLFSPGGLFNQLAPTAEERKVLVRSSLFRQAQVRFRELQRSEAEAFSRTVAQVQNIMSSGNVRIKIERSEKA